MLRSIYIILLLIKYSAIFLAIKFNLYRQPKQDFLKTFFEEAGGAFIKFGQILALRVDLIPQEYTVGLLDLLDNLSPFPYKEVENSFLNELGAKPDEIFHDFQKEPFASASFAQVHAAKLKDTKEIVVVKVMRPGIEEKVAIDLFLIKIFAFIADNFFKVSALPWQEFADELANWTKLELDYHNEAENGEKLYQNFKGDKEIVIPKIYHSLTTKRILVEEYIEGIHFSRVLKRLRDGRLDEEKLAKMGINLKKIPRTISQSLLKQAFLHGIFHADPHPGNIILLKNDKIALIDFGIMGSSSLFRQKAFIKFMKHAANYEYKDAAYHAAQFLGVDLKQMIISALPANTDEKFTDDIIKSLTDHFSINIEKIVSQDGQKIRELKSDHSMMFMNILRNAESLRFKVPKEMAIFIRTMTIISILSKQIDISLLATDMINEFFSIHSEEEVLKGALETPPIKRLNREVALEKLNNWLSYLFETDPEVYKLVNNYIKNYNLSNG